jgi:hypothetical protein
VGDFAIGRAGVRSFDGLPSRALKFFVGEDNPRAGVRSEVEDFDCARRDMAASDKGKWMK